MKYNILFSLKSMNKVKNYKINKIFMKEGYNGKNKQKNQMKNKKGKTYIRNIMDCLYLKQKKYNQNINNKL